MQKVYLLFKHPSQDTKKTLINSKQKHTFDNSIELKINNKVKKQRLPNVTQKQNKLKETNSQNQLEKAKYINKSKTAGAGGINREDTITNKTKNDKEYLKS